MLPNEAITMPDRTNQTQLDIKQDKSLKTYTSSVRTVRGGGGGGGCRVGCGSWW